jgi:DNA-binding transcriptional LysR family regulator
MTTPEKEGSTVRHMELRQLIALRAVAEERSFGKAAAQIGYTQSAVSQQIASLERSLGCRVFERPPSRADVKLTDAGAIVLRHAEVIAAEIAATRADLEALQRTGPRPLRVGTHVSSAGSALADVIGAFDPGRSEGIELVESAADGAFVDLLQRGELDVAWLHVPLKSSAIEWIEAITDPFVLVVARGAARVTIRPLSDVRALSGVKLATLRSSPARVQLRRFFVQEALQPDFVLESDDPAFLAEFTLSSGVPSLIPASLVPRDQGALDVIRLPRIPPRRLGIGWCPAFEDDGRRSRFVDAAVRTYDRLGRALELPVSSASA